jgi:hypothetical protein
MIKRAIPPRGTGFQVTSPDGQYHLAFRWRRENRPRIVSYTIWLKKDGDAEFCCPGEDVIFSDNYTFGPDGRHLFLERRTDVTIAGCDVLMIDLLARRWHVLVHIPKGFLHEIRFSEQRFAPPPWDGKTLIVKYIEEVPHPPHAMKITVDVDQLHEWEPMPWFGD